MTLVQQKAGQAFATTLTLTPTAATTAGSCLILLVQHQANATVTITDSAGGTWVKAFSTNDLSTPATAQRLASIYYRLTAGSVTSVTATIGSQSALNAILMEHSGIVGFRGAGGANITSGATTAPIPTAAGDLVVGLAAWGATSRGEAVSSGYTATDSASTGTSGTITYLAGAYRPAAAGGTEGPTWTGISATVGVVTAAFVTAASSGGHQANNFRGGTAGSTMVQGSGGNTGGASGDFFDGVTANAWIFATVGGALAAKASAPQADAILRKSLPVLDPRLQIVEVFTAGAAPASEFHMTQASWGTAIGADSATSFILRRQPDNTLRFQTVGTGATAYVWASTGVLVPGTRYRRVVWVDMSTGRAHAAIYPDGSATPVTGLDSGVLGTTTPLNLGPTTGAGFTNTRRGKYDANPYAGDVIVHSVDVYYGAAAADDNGLAKVTGGVLPTVTLDKTTGPVPRTDGTGGTEVTATVAWTGGGNGSAQVFGVDWGDGTPITNPLVSGSTFKHIYTTPGTYQVTPYADNVA